MHFRSCRFVALAGLIGFVAVAAAEDAGDPMHKLMLYDFEGGAAPWVNVDDVVMGGVSSSDFRVSDGVGVFEGRVSLENNGGFASVRSGQLQYRLGGFEGVRLRVRGDGQRYQFRVRTTRGYDGPSYRAAFDTAAGEWQEVLLRWDDFTASFRGRELPNHPPIAPAEVRSFGFLIADKQAGPFRLEIDWIQAWKQENATEAETNEPAGA